MIRTGFENLAFPERTVRGVVGLFRAVVPRHCHTFLTLLRWFIRDPTPEHLADYRSTRIVRVGEVKPISKLDRPALIIQLIDELPILARNAVRGYVGNAFTVCPVHGLDVTRACDETGKMRS